MRKSMLLASLSAAMLVASGIAAQACWDGAGYRGYYGYGPGYYYGYSPTYYRYSAYYSYGPRYGYGPAYYGYGPGYYGFGAGYYGYGASIGLGYFGDRLRNRWADRAAYRRGDVRAYRAGAARSVGRASVAPRGGMGRVGGRGGGRR